MSNDIDISSALNYAASILGTKIISYKDHQCLIESNNTYIRFFERHPMNRHVDMDWVKELKSEMLSMLLAKECTMIDLAVNINDIETAIRDPDYTKEQGGFKAIILDGQHRIEALKQIVQENKDISFDIWLRVFIVNRDEDIIKRIDTLNKRRGFNQSDIDKQGTVQNFLLAIQQIIGSSNLKRQYYIKIKNSKILNDKNWINKNKLNTTQDFIKKINNISLKYINQYECKIEDEKFNRSIINQTIKDTNMYQFIEIDPNEWIKLI